MRRCLIPTARKSHGWTRNTAKETWLLGSSIRLGAYTTNSLQFCAWIHVTSLGIGSESQIMGSHRWDSFTLSIVNGQAWPKFIHSESTRLSMLGRQACLQQFSFPVWMLLRFITCYYEGPPWRRSSFGRPWSRQVRPTESYQVWYFYTLIRNYSIGR